MQMKTVDVQVDLDDETVNALMKTAHENNITLNHLVERILYNKIIEELKMKIKLDADSIDGIVRKTILQDIKMLREQVTSLKSEINYNPEYLTRNSLANQDLQDNLYFLQALEAAAEFYIGHDWSRKLYEVDDND